MRNSTKIEAFTDAGILAAEEFANRELYSVGPLLDLCDTPQVREGWATYLGVSESALTQKGGQSVKVAIRAKKQKSQNETRREIAVEILDRYTAEISREESTEFCELTLLGGLASREAGLIYDATLSGGLKTEECGGIESTPLEWGMLVKGELAKLTRFKLGNLAKTDAVRRTAGREPTTRTC